MAGDNPELRIVIEGEGEQPSGQPAAAPGLGPGPSAEAGAGVAGAFQRDLDQFKQYQQRLVSEESKYSAYRQSVRSGGQQRDLAYEASAKEAMQSIRGGMEALGEVFKSLESLAKSNIPQAAEFAGVLDQYKSLQQPTTKQPQGAQRGPRGMYQRGSPQRRQRALGLIRRRRHQQRAAARPIPIKSFVTPRGMHQRGSPQRQAKAVNLLRQRRRKQRQKTARVAQASQRSANAARRAAVVAGRLQRHHAAANLRGMAVGLQAAGTVMGRGGRVAQIASMGFRGAAGIVGGGGVGGAGAAAGLGGAAGIMAIAAPLAAGAAAVAGLTGATYALVTSINEQTARYGQLSSLFQETQASLSVRGLQLDFMRSQAISPYLSQFSERKFGIDQSWEDTKANLTQQFEPILAAAMEKLAETLNGVNLWLSSVDLSSTFVDLAYSVAEGIAGAFPGSGNIVQSLDFAKRALLLWIHLNELKLTEFKGDAHMDDKNWNDLFNMQVPGFQNKRAAAHQGKRTAIPGRQAIGGPKNVP